MNKNERFRRSLFFAILFGVIFTTAVVNMITANKSGDLVEQPTDWLCLLNIKCYTE